MNTEQSQIHNQSPLSQSALDILTASPDNDLEPQSCEQIKKELQAAQQELSHIKLALNEAAIVAITNAQGNIQYVNDKFCHLSKYSQAEILGQDHRLVNSGHHPKEFFQNLWSTISQGNVWHGEIKNKAKDGTPYWVDTTIVPSLDEQGKPFQYLAIHFDITERKRIEERLIYDAFHDVLTGLPNRALFMDRLSRAMEHVKRRPHALFALLFVDLDHFKHLNDSLGHLIGDQLLVAVSHRLESCLRLGDTVARFGGDEFTILLEDIRDIHDAVRITERLQRELETPFYLNGHQITTSASIGIALSASEYNQPEEILRDADLALYQAKALGRMRHEVFNSSMHSCALAHVQLEHDLRRAIAQACSDQFDASNQHLRELQLYYQPIVALKTNRIVGFEALIRWHHPEQGLIPPSDFIPIAENNGLIIALGHWVLQEACRQLQVWQQQLSSGIPLMISVNLSGRQFAQPDLVQQISQILEKTGLSARSLKLEITESVVMENADTATVMLKQLKSLGIQLSIDDFGTGYSSLSYLHQFPIDTLKIDRSFINGIDVDGENLEIVRTIVTLAWNLGMDVIAEGVETNKQLSQVKALQCEYAQGYFFSPAVNADAAWEILTTGFSKVGVQNHP